LQPPGAAAYVPQADDAVRAQLEIGFFARLIPGLLAEAGGGRLVDLGCGEGMAARLAGPALTEYTGVDFRDVTKGGQRPPLQPTHVQGGRVLHDLGDGFGPVGSAPFDVYLATFGVVSHLDPSQLERLLREVAAHARPGSVIALEALGLGSLEWPRLWETAPGPRRLLPYRLASDVTVHPWSPRELCALHREAGLRPVRVLDRSLQPGPKTGEDRYWPGLPPLRRALDDLLDGHREAAARGVLAQPLPPLPAGRAAAVHHGLGMRRQRLVVQRGGSPAGLARAVWALEADSGGGFGHGLTVVARKP
jgi:SAM-dependent methyltransferase